MFLLDREAFRTTRRLVGWILQQKVHSHNIQYALRHVQKPFSVIGKVFDLHGLSCLFLSPSDLSSG